MFLIETSPELYKSECGEYTMQREYGETPNGNDLGGRWVLRNSSGRMVDFDQYRNDLAARNSLTIKHS
jgi:hypothetical protein